MHIAAMLGVPTVALFTLRHSPTHWFPLGTQVAALFSIPDCIFCYNDYCGALDCLTSIEADQVISALERLLSAE
jgi:ADP-heptose:LPS heptosyltransferase